MDELQQAQESLGRALERARAGDDPRLAAQVRERGEQMTNLLSGLLRMSRVHASDNRAFDQPIGELRNAIAGLIALVGAIHLVAVEDQVYLNEIRIRQPPSAKEGRSVGTELALHNVGGITFHAAPTEEQLRKLLGLFMSKPAAKTPRLALQNQLRAAGIPHLELAVLHRFRRADEVEEVVQKPDPRKLAARTCGLVEELWDNLAAKRQPNVLPLRRAVGELLQIGPGFEALYWDIPSAAPHALHSFRVCQDALIIGVAAGLPEGTLQDLGVAALVHDVGYATQPPPAFDAHPLAGARLLLGQVGFHEAKVRRALAALDHHREFKDARGTPSLFGRILRIAEDYQGLLRKTGGNLPPTTALATLVPGASRRYDPVLLQLFFNRLGYYPPLSVLQLEDGRLVRTLSLVRSVETFATPRAVCLRLADGTTPKQAVLVDLAKEGKVVRVLRGS